MKRLLTPTSSAPIANAIFGIRQNFESPCNHNVMIIIARSKIEEKAPYNIIYYPIAEVTAAFAGYKILYHC